MDQRKTLIITVESLPTYLLGVYGADNALTPNLDTLAAHGLVLDRLYAEVTDGIGGLESLLTGEHFLRRTRPGSSPKEVPISGARHTASESSQSEFSAEPYLKAAMVTDCPAAASLVEKYSFASVTRTDGDEVLSPVDDAMQCAMLAPWFAVAEAISEGVFDSSECDCLWLHSKGLGAAWDAPSKLRQRFADPEDPEPPEGVEPPEFPVASDTDPDLLIGWAQVASAQAAVLDTGVGVVLSALEIAGVCCDIIFTSLGGYPLGEHGVVGLQDTPLQETTLHLAGLMSHFPVPSVPGTRSPDVVQLSTIGRQLKKSLAEQGGTQLLSNPSVLKASAGYQFALAVKQAIESEESKANYWARTPAWSCRIDAAQEQLYAMPDDKWETNDIASRMLPAVDLIREETQRHLAQLYTGEAFEAQPLDDLLTSLNR